MKTLRAFTALVAVLLAGAAVRGAARPSNDGDGHKKGQEFGARLTGAEEVPAVVTDTSGKVEIFLSSDETKLEFELAVRKGVRVTQSHIHCAPKGTNGPIVVFLAGFHNRGWDVDGTWVENATATDDNVIPPAPGGPCPVPINNLRDLAAAIRGGNTYVNVHTVAHPGGEIRGQLRVDDDEDEDH
jgi:CHRD domain-containing protein